jgi:hypothetical protein
MIYSPVDLTARQAAGHIEVQRCYDILAFPTAITINDTPCNQEYVLQLV